MQSDVALYPINPSFFAESFGCMHGIRRKGCRQTLNGNRLDKLDDAFLFIVSFIGLLITIIQASIFGTSVQSLVEVLPLLFLGMVMPLYIGYFRGGNINRSRQSFSCGKNERMGLLDYGRSWVLRIHLFLWRVRANRSDRDVDSNVFHSCCWLGCGFPCAKMVH